MNRAGQETVLMNIFRTIDRSELQFDFLLSVKEQCDYTEEILALGGKIHYLPPVFRRPFGRFFGLKKLIKREGYNIVHCHSSQSLRWTDLLAAKRGGAAKLVYHAHNSSSKYKALHFLFRPLNNLLSTHKVSCSESATVWVFGKNTYHKGNVKIIPNAIDIEKFKFDPRIRECVRDSMGLQDKFVVGHIGRFTHQKNHEFLINIFAEAHRQCPNAVLMLVGDGELKPEIEKMVDCLGLHNAVLFLGIRQDVHELYQAMDVLVLPSFYEGLPGTVLEAQSAGLPCIISSTITDEVVLTDGCKKLGFDAKQDWMDAILKGQRSMNGHEEVRRAGFDISDSIKWWNDLYIEMGAASHG
jgi:glycosyltransferase involved in cell wall biosynthesis